MSKIIDATKAEKVVIPNEICIEGTHIILRHEGVWQITDAWPHDVYCSYAMPSLHRPIGKCGKTGACQEITVRTAELI